MAEPVNCPDCGQRVGVNDSGNIVSRQAAGKRNTCPGSGKSA
jgi:hypothetical protein